MPGEIGLVRPGSSDDQIVLGVLDAVEQDPALTQRSVARDLGIALGLANAYLNRCIRKGLIKVAQAPARRYAYYLTPQGFAEKSRLTAEFLSSSFSFFRATRTHCAEVCAEAKARGWSTLVLAGASDVAEIAALCAMEAGLVVSAVVDAEFDRDRFVGLTVCRDFADLKEKPDAVVVTAIRDTHAVAAHAAAAMGADCVLVPTLLRRTLLHRESAHG
jgi:DNA-binding MarR family transcriptional regulator